MWERIQNVLKAQLDLAITSYVGCNPMCGEWSVQSVHTICPTILIRCGPSVNPPPKLLANVTMIPYQCNLLTTTSLAVSRTELV